MPLSNHTVLGITHLLYNFDLVVRARTHFSNDFVLLASHLLFCLSQNNPHFRAQWTDHQSKGEEEWDTCESLTVQLPRLKRQSRKADEMKQQIDNETAATCGGSTTYR